MDNVIESYYRLRANVALTGTATPPPIILKFCSEQLKLGVLKVKRLSMPAPPQEEKDAGILRYAIVEDLTPQAFSKLKELIREESVEKAWTVDGRIKFLVRGNKKIHTVKSVYDPITDILSKT